LYRVAQPEGLHRAEFVKRGAIALSRDSRIGELREIVAVGELVRPSPHGERAAI
jgi:hypothetical protein